jgi:hypothetical protein
MPDPKPPQAPDPGDVKDDEPNLDLVPEDQPEDERIEQQNDVA